MKSNDALMSPFFARFLENQKSNSGTHGVFPWPLPPITDKLRDHLDETQKYPSDNDEDIFI